MLSAFLKHNSAIRKFCDSILVIPNTSVFKFGSYKPSARVQLESMAFRSCSYHSCQCNGLPYYYNSFHMSNIIRTPRLRSSILSQSCSLMNFQSNPDVCCKNRCVTINGGGGEERTEWDLCLNHTVPHTKKEFGSRKSERTADDIAGMRKYACYISSLCDIGSTEVANPTLANLYLVHKDSNYGCCLNRNMSRLRMKGQQQMVQTGFSVDIFLQWDCLTKEDGQNEQQ